MKMLGIRSVGLSLSLEKGLPLGSGLGSSAASAAAYRVEGGAFRCTISGAGPKAVVVIDGEERGREISDRMVRTFIKEGNLRAKAVVKRLDREGARVVCSVPKLNCN